MSTSPTIERRPLDVSSIPLRGVHLIEASAGTGKTYTITSLVLRLLVEEELPVESILAVTFTNAATAELKSRVYERILQAKAALDGARASDRDPAIARLLAHPDKNRARRLLAIAARDVDRAAIFTIHGFSARMLSDYSFESKNRDDTELIGDQRALVQDVVTDFWTTHVATLPERTFAQLGGTGLFRTLMRVGLTAAGTEEVPLVDITPPAGLEERIEILQGIFEEARTAFSRDGQELQQILLKSTSLNRNKYRPASVAADYLGYLAYFERGEATLGHPPTDRWTASKVESSLKKNQIPIQHPLLSVLERLYDAYTETETIARQEADQLRARLCHEVRARVGLEHERAGTQSFDGLLSGLARALRSESGSELARALRHQFPVAMIDEFQDTDPIQYEIFRRIYMDAASQEGARFGLYLIGDPKQSIYAFRGADVRTYLSAAREATGGIWTLDVSYRAAPRLVRAQNVIFAAPRDAFGVEGIAYHPVGHRPGAEDVLLGEDALPLPGLVLLESEDADESTALVATAREVARFLSSNITLAGHPVTPSDVAVLSRTNRQAQELQAHLRQLGIPAVMHGDRSVFEAPEALELRRVMLALAEPGNRTLVRTALSTRMLGLSAAQLLELDRDVQLLERWTTDLRAWGQLWKTRGIAHAMEALSFATGLAARTLQERDGERRMTNFRHLLELLHDAQTREHLGVAGLLRYFEGTIADPSSFAMAAEARQLRLESDAQAVTLTTAHKSKGLEYNVVFLPALGLPDRGFNDDAFRFFDPGRGESLLEMRHKDSREGSEELHSLEEKQEALRLCYVALTRAKHHVVVFTPHCRSFSSLHYLLHERCSGDPGGLEALGPRLKKLTPEMRRAEIEPLTIASEGAVAYRPLSDNPAPPYHRTPETSELVPPRALLPLLEREKTSSFSAMTRDSHAGLSRAAREGHDVDEIPVELALGSTSVSDKRCVLADFPRGARPGDALHAVFEFSPFAEGTPEDRRIVAARELSRRGFDAALFDAVSESVEDVLRVPMSIDSVSSPIVLGDLGPEDRAPEMEFSLPVGSAERRLSPARLARALGFEEDAPGAPVGYREQATIDGVLTGRYLRAVSTLAFSAWSGFLRGYMDLVYVFEGKIFGLDYKSNHLGDAYADYTQEALQSAMEEHHYLLQALLYAVAIHRYASARIPGYTYDEHFGGMQYLFVRGMHPDVPSSGVFSYRPSQSVIESLDSALREIE